MQKLHEMQQIRCPALAVAVLEQSRKHAMTFDEAPQHADEAGLVPFPVRVPKALDDSFPGAFVRAKRIELFAAASEHGGHEGATDKRFAARLRNRGENALELFGFIRRENAAGAALHAGDAALRE